MGFAFSGGSRNAPCAASMNSLYFSTSCSLGGTPFGTAIPMRL
jgi:hypothetical protein